MLQQVAARGVVCGPVDPGGTTEKQVVVLLVTERKEKWKEITYILQGYAIILLPDLSSWFDSSGSW